jgi:hypothetical protein
MEEKVMDIRASEIIEALKKEHRLPKGMYFLYDTKQRGLYLKGFVKARKLTKVYVDGKWLDTYIDDYKENNKAVCGFSIKEGF